MKIKYITYWTSHQQKENNKKEFLLSKNKNGNGKNLIPKSHLLFYWCDYKTITMQWLCDYKEITSWTISDRSKTTGGAWTHRN